MNLDRIATLLEQAGDQHWAASLRQDAADLAAGDIRGAQHFLSAFGGMGSLNDHYYCSPERKDSKDLAPDEQIGKELSHAWDLARALIGNR